MMALYDHLYIYILLGKKKKTKFFIFSILEVSCPFRSNLSAESIYIYIERKNIYFERKKCARMTSFRGLKITTFFVTALASPPQ